MKMRKMKMMTVFLLCLIAGTACSQENGAKVTVDIRPLKTDTLVMNDGTEAIHAKPGKDGKYVFNFKSGFPKIINISIMKTRQRMSFYIEKGDNLNVVTDFGNKTTFSGKGANNARVFYENFSFMMKAWKAIEVKGHTPTDLYNQFDAMFKTPLNNLEANKKSVSALFYNTHYDWLYYQALGYKFDVPFWYMRETDKKLSESIPDHYWDLIKLARLDDKVVKTDEYRSTMFVSFPGFLENEYKVKSGHPDSSFNKDDVFTHVYRRMEKLCGDQTRGTFLAKQLQNQLGTMKDPSPLKPLIDEYVQKYNTPENAANIKDVQEQYKTVASLAPGREPSPFVLKDAKGKDVTLKDFAGKVVYMDFWASWCSPCRAQMKEAAPKLHKMFEGNKDVVFLYINLDKTTAAGEKAIAEDKIVGIHLFAGDFSADNPIAKAFNISGIPRYVIIGKDGKIFDVDAPRPSDDSTPKRIEEALNAK